MPPTLTLVLISKGYGECAFNATVLCSGTNLLLASDMTGFDIAPDSSSRIAQHGAVRTPTAMQPPVDSLGAAARALSTYEHAGSDAH
jgi:hypothetical protein